MCCGNGRIPCVTESRFKIEIQGGIHFVWQTQELRWKICFHYSQIIFCEINPLLILNFVKTLESSAVQSQIKVPLIVLMGVDSCDIVPPPCSEYIYLFSTRLW